MRGAIVLVASALVAACAGVKTYPTDASGNVTLRADLERGVQASVHVHAVEPDCTTRYQGRVALTSPATVISLAPERLSYLVATFDTSSFLRGASSMSAGTLLRPRAGRSYELALRYRADVYDILLRETDARGTTRQLERKALGDCRAS